MHGAGNDYVFCDGFVETIPTNSAELAVRVSDRHLGIGADGLVLMQSPDSAIQQSVSQQSATRTTSSVAVSRPDVLMRMWNADGSEGTMCGNAARCVAFWMKRMGRVTDQCRIQMGNIHIVADVSLTDASMPTSDAISLTLPSPSYAGAIELPDLAELTQFSSLLSSQLTRNQLTCYQVDCGNPHVVIFVDSLSDQLVRSLGPAVENHAAFLGRSNVEFVCVRDRHTLEVRVWERGSGETLACGSGACAAAVASISQGKCDSTAPVSVCLPGGTLTVTWRNLSNLGHSSPLQAAPMVLTGPVCLEFVGTWVGDSR